MCKRPVQQISQQLARERNSKKKKSVVFYDPNRIRYIAFSAPIHRAYVVRQLADPPPTS
jgi:hypothetical protein